MVIRTRTFLTIHRIYVVGEKEKKIFKRKESCITHMKLEDIIFFKFRDKEIEKFVIYSLTQTILDE